MASWPGGARKLCGNVHGMAGSGSMHPNVLAVVVAAEQRGLRLDVREFAAGTRTAADAAAAIGVEIGQIVKSLVFMVDDQLVVALASGSNQVDEALLAEAAGGARVSRADAETVRAVTSFPIGGVPPIGFRDTVPTYLDKDLLQYEVVWAAAGTPRHVFAIAPSTPVDVSRASVAPLAATQPRGS